uniref:Uncharacterized protein n=1 Tax=Timema monikensis TaxID=170555 RepID=A0A7R9EF40_9NEOP|nr:unnamed protein product [Timema monikensis]
MCCYIDRPCPSTKLIADVNSLLLVVSCQGSRHKFGGGTGHPQLDSQNSLAYPMVNSHLGKVVNSLTLFLAYDLLKFDAGTSRPGIGPGLRCLQWCTDSVIAFHDAITVYLPIQYRGYLKNQASHYAQVFSIAICFL